MNDADWKEARFRRDRIIVMLLLALIISGLLFYMITVVSTAREWRRQNALQLNESTARLSARLIDEQCENAQDVLRSLARPTAMGATATSPQGIKARYLREAVDLVPDLMATALYDASGKRLAKYPSTSVFPAVVTHTPWFRQVKKTQVPFLGTLVDVYDGNTPQAFTIAVPVESKTQDSQYLVAYYRLGNSAKWLHDIRLSGGTVLLSDAKGHIVMASGSHPEIRAIPAGYPALVDAIQGKSGAALLTHPGRDSTAVVGYALSRQPQLVVLVVQPVSSAFAATDYLLQRILVVTVPLVILVPLAAWNLLGLYHRVQLLARFLSERNEHLKRSAKMKSDLLANVSHDLKTPIASMQLSLSGVMETEKAILPTATQECLTLCSEELAHLSARVRNLLDMSRLDVDESISLWEPCDITDIVGSALERVGMLMRNRPIHADFPAEPLLLECDQNQMETVIVNLVENAIKYSPTGSAIHVSGGSNETMVSFTIRDEGPGISPGETVRIFDKFYRLGTSYAPGGTGLGLAICKTIVEAHGGTIRADNAAGGGAIFSVALPAAKDCENEDAKR